MTVPSKCCVGNAQRQSKDKAALIGPRVAQSLGAENSCATGRGFSHMRRTNQKEEDLLETASERYMLPSTPCFQEHVKLCASDQRAHGVSRCCL